MTTIYCDCDCKNSKDGICQQDEINLNTFDGCEDYDGIMMIDLPDTYYAICEGEEKEDYFWREQKGVKIEIEGRVVFDKFGYLTDGRTGMGLGEKGRGVIERVPEWKELHDEKEKIHGPSPLYGEPKYRILKLKEGNI